MLSETRYQLLVGAILIIVAFALLAWLLLSGPQARRRGYRVSVDFDSVENLQPNSEVRFSGRLAGYVIQIRHSASVGEPELRTRWRVDLWLHQTTEKTIPHRSEVFVHSEGVIIGKRYIEITAKTEDVSHYIRAGDVLRGTDPPPFDRVLQYSYDAMTEIFAIVEEQRPIMQKLIAEALLLYATVTNLIERHGNLIPQIKTLIDEAKPVLATLQGIIHHATRSPTVIGRWKTIATTHEPQFKHIADTASAIGEDQTQLAATFSPELLATFTNAIERLKTTLAYVEVIQTHTSRITEQLRREQGTLMRLIKDKSIFDELRESHRLLKETPWKVLGPMQTDSKHTVD